MVGRRTGNAFWLLAFMATVAGLGLSVSLRFPEVLLDPPSFGASLVSARPVAAVAGLLGLAAAGALVWWLSRALPAARLAGAAAGWCLVASGAAGLVLTVLWGNELNTASTVVSTIVFAVFGLVVPLLLAAWTTGIVRAVGAGAITGWLAVAGLVSTATRSATWWLNATLPTQDGFYLVSSVLTLVALAGTSIWIFWLIRGGFSLRASGPVAAPGRGLAAVARRCGLGLLTLLFVLVGTAAAIVSTPIPHTPDVPSVPSAAAAFFQPVMLAAAGQFAQPTSYPDLLEQREDERFTTPRTPAGTTIDKVDAGDVPAEFLCATGATKDRVFLYLHGGGFIMPMSNSHRDFAAALSRETGSCLLMPHYRLAPEHPFPAAIEDSVAAYRWLLRTGVPASAVTIIGDSCGGTFTLSTALSLQHSGDEPPGALVALSPGTDLTFTGGSHRSNAWTDPLIAADHKRFVQRSYTGDGAADVRDPLLSPLFADTSDLAALPPTLLQVGSEETLLSDSIRMADRMRMVGGDVELEVWPGMPHTVPLVFPEIMEADVTFQHIADFSAAHTS